MNFRCIIPDISIRIVERIDFDFKPEFEDQFAKIADQSFFLHVPNIADFLLENGNSVLIVPHPKSTKESIELYLNGTIFGVAMQQRRIFTLHASSFKLDDKSIAICGASGRGKSTLTYTFCNLGATFLTDDVTPVMANGKIEIQPVSDRMKIWGNVLKSENNFSDDLLQIRPEIDKFFVEMKHHSETEVLSCIVIVDEEEKEEHSLTELSGAEKLNVLMNQMYRPEYLTKSARIDFFPKLNKIVGEIPMYNYQRKQLSDPDSSVQSSVEFLRKALSF